MYEFAGRIFQGWEQGSSNGTHFWRNFPEKYCLVRVVFFLMTGKQHFTLPKHYSGKWVTTIFLGQVFIVGLITMDQRWLKNHLHGTT